MARRRNGELTRTPTLPEAQYTRGLLAFSVPLAPEVAVGNVLTQGLVLVPSHPANLRVLDGLVVAVVPPVDDAHQFAQAPCFSEEFLALLNKHEESVAPFAPLYRSRLYHWGNDNLGSHRHEAQRPTVNEAYVEVVHSCISHQSKPKKLRHHGTRSESF